MSNDYVEREVPVAFNCETCGRFCSGMYVLRLPVVACTLTDHQSIKCVHCGNEVVLEMFTEQKNVNHAVTTMKVLGKEYMVKHGAVREYASAEQPPSFP